MTTILSIDGGGVRGIFPVKILMELEQRLGAPLHNVVDIFAGTSTGSLIAGCLAMGMPASEVINIYVKDPIQKIFKRNLLGSIGINPHKYDAKNIEEVFQDTYGEAKLNNLKSHLVVPADDWVKRQGVIFSTFSDNTGMYLWEIIRASCAAETYFKPYNGLFDGSLWANDPSSIALCEAIEYLKPKLEDVTIISLGTGSVIRKIDNDKVSKLRMFDFLMNKLLFEEIIDRNVKKTNDLMRKLPLKAYHRLQFDCPSEYIAMDNTNLKHINNLVDLAERNINTIFASDIEKIVDELKQNPKIVST